MSHPRVTTLIRRNDVFERVLRGQTYAQICKELDMSEDTVSRDLTAIAEQVKELAKERLGALVAMALENYQFVIDQARANYEADAERLTKWYKGKLDYKTEHVVTKTLAIAGGEEDEGGRGSKSKHAAAEAAYRDLALQQESQPLEVRRTTRIVRPALVNNREVWLRLIVEATREICALFNVQKQIIEVSGPGGGPVPHAFGSLEDWKAEAQRRIAQANTTYELLGDDAEGDDA